MTGLATTGEALKGSSRGRIMQHSIWHCLLIVHQGMHDGRVVVFSCAACHARGVIAYQPEQAVCCCDLNPTGLRCSQTHDSHTGMCAAAGGAMLQTATTGLGSMQWGWTSMAWPALTCGHPPPSATQMHRHWHR
jgi:hypothetical protein